VNCCCAATKIEELAGVTTSEIGTAAVTVRTAPLLTAPELAEIVVLPGKMLVAYPVEFMTATAGAEEAQVDD